MSTVKTSETLGIPYLLLNPAAMTGEGSFSSTPERNRELCRFFFGEASQKEIQYTSRGQPYLDHPGDFSLSHKKNFFLLCGDGGGPWRVGCDIEDLSQHRSWGLFREALTENEIRLFRRLAGHLPEAMILLLLFSWRECLLKANGFREINLRLTGLQVRVSEVHALVTVQNRAVGEIIAWREKDLLLSLCKLELS